MRTPLPIDRPRLGAFCRRWKIVEVAVFGSVLRDDVRPDSDVDLLVRFAAEASPTLFDYVRMGDELQDLFGRPVHLVDRRALEASPNRVLRRAILETAVPVAVGMETEGVG